MNTPLNRNQALELLEKFSNYLMKDGYLDFDFVDEKALDTFITSEWFTKQFPIIIKIDGESI